MSTCKWPLGDGTVLEFTVYGFNTDWNQVPGLYIFAYVDGNRWNALYIGQAMEFSSRLPSHELRQEARRNGATHIHAIVVQQAANRDKWEKMLIKHLDPPMNRQHRPYPMVPPIFGTW